MGLLQSVLTDGGPRRRLRLAGHLLRRPLTTRCATLSVRRWSQRTIIALVMQSVDNSLTVAAPRPAGPLAAGAGPGHGAPNPTWIPAGNEAARLLAEEIGGMPGRLVTEVVRHADDRALPRRRRRSAPTPTDGVVDPTTGSSATPGCTSSTARRSAPTSA